MNKSLEFKEKEAVSREYRDSSPLFVASQDEDEDIKDKPSLKTDYTGFGIYDKALWLVVTDTDPKRRQESEKKNTVVLDEWITMTQQNSNIA